MVIEDRSAVGAMEPGQKGNALHIKEVSSGGRAAQALMPPFRLTSSPRAPLPLRSRPKLQGCHLRDRCDWRKATYARTGTAVACIIAELPGERAEALFIATAALVPTAGEQSEIQFDKVGARDPR